MPDNIQELLVIAMPQVSITIKGTPTHQVFSGIRLDERVARLIVRGREAVDLAVNGGHTLVATKPLVTATEQHYAVCPLFFEQSRYELVVEPEMGHTATLWHENINIRQNITKVGRRGDMLSGIINFGNDVGLSDFVLSIDGQEYLRFTLEVFPSKISYQEDYRAILSDVTSEVYNLAFDFLKKTYSSFNITDTKKSSPVEFFAIIDYIYEKLIAAVDLLLTRPHHALICEHELLPAHKIKRVDNKTLRYLAKHPGRLQKSSGGVLAPAAVAVKKHITYDTKENRLTKYMLLATEKRLQEFRQKYISLLRTSDATIQAKIDGMLQGIRQRLHRGIMEGLVAEPGNSSMSLVFAMAPGYRELYRCYLLLRHGLALTGDIFRLSVKDLAVLYEYWCFIKLNSLMRSRYQLLSQDIVKTSGNGLFVSLVKGRCSEVKYLNPMTGEIIMLAYNPKAANGATVAQKPDNVLRLNKHGSGIDYEFIFDAKYKINPALPGSRYKMRYSTPGPQEDDINTMHRYRDAIVYQKGASAYERMMFGAYVLFPYHNQNEYREHRFYKSIAEVNIGGIPFLPSATDMVSAMLDELISDSAESAFERATLPRGIEKRLAKVDWDRRDVLIGTFKSVKQFAVCKEKNFYYIPQKLITERDLPIHYVAMYQSLAKFGDMAGISYYGEILTMRSVPRSAIKEVALTRNNPDEPYYYIEIKEWLPLKRSILPKEYGLPYNFTNLFLLTNVEYYPELFIRSEEEYRFYIELKRRTAKDADSEILARGFELENIRVQFIDDTIHILKSGKLVATRSITDFLSRPNLCFRQIWAKLNAGG